MINTVVTPHCLKAKSLRIGGENVVDEESQQLYGAGLTASSAVNKRPVRPAEPGDLSSLLSLLGPGTYLLLFVTQRLIRKELFNDAFGFIERIVVQESSGDERLPVRGVVTRRRVSLIQYDGFRQQVGIRPRRFRPHDGRGKRSISSGCLGSQHERG